MASYTLVSKDSCPFCVMAKDLLAERNLPFAESKLGADITKDELLRRVPDARTVPQIWSPHGEHIGGFTELKSHLGA